MYGFGYKPPAQIQGFWDKTFGAGRKQSNGNGSGLGDILARANAPKQISKPIRAASGGGKFYGQDTLAEHITNYDSSIAGWQSSLDYYSNPANAYARNNNNSNSTGGMGLNLRQPMSAGGRASAIANAQANISEGMKLKDEFISAGYAQHERFNQSYNADKAGWNKYMESAYKAPRIAEENDNKAARQGDTSGMGVLKFSNTSLNKRDVGTGVPSREFNPFGGTGTGLGV